MFEKRGGYYYRLSLLVCTVVYAEYVPHIMEVAYC